VLKARTQCPSGASSGAWHALEDRHFCVHISTKLVFRVIKSGHVAGMGETRGVYRVLVGKPEGNGPLGRPRRRWEENINSIINNFSIHNPI
jgi:hypothetical protein